MGNTTSQREVPMDVSAILKAISNDARRQILGWLKSPLEHFTPVTQADVDLVATGVCVSQITKKLDMTQSTASIYLNTLQKADLVIATRIGKWTYYRRNEAVIKQFAQHISDDL